MAKHTGLDAADERRQIITMPGYQKQDRSRVELKLPIVPPHESFVDEVRSNPAMLANLDLDDVEGNDWSDNFLKHPDVATPGPRTIPGAFYFDGVPYTKADGVIGFWFYSLTTQVRHLCCVVRRRHLCRCGCMPAGWCTINAILTYLAWSLQALVQGVYPTKTHEEIEWDAAAEPVRRDLGGSQLGFRVAIVQIKADWSEWAHVLGFPTWPHKEFPCALCHADATNLFDFEGISPLGCPESWGVGTTSDEIEACCEACEIKARVPRSQFDLIKDALEWGKAAGVEG